MTSPFPEPASVLVVDDDDDARGLVVLALRRAGLRVTEAKTGSAALDIVGTETIGLVVLDLVMPGMSGTDVIRALRSRSQTATLPILLMTGSGDEDSVIRGLETGADDFLPKPVRLDELIARVNTHLRQQRSWSRVVEDELRNRAAVVAALGRITISSDPEEAAEAVVRELAKRTDSDFVAVLQLGIGGTLQELATYDRVAGVQRGGHRLGAAFSRHVLGRATEGPWIEEVKTPGPTHASPTLGSTAPEISVGAPIYAGDDLVGILTIGIANGGANLLVRRDRLLAAAIDYADVLSTRAGTAFADRRDIAVARGRLEHVLTAHEFHPVYQPIVDLATESVVGFEALTRFDDGTPPDVRFAEADGLGLGPDFELSTIQAALDGASHLPSGAFLSINVSPSLVLRGARRFVKQVKTSTRGIVLELTEHVPIDDYPTVREALARLDVSLAVDDAGAGFASLRHILELRPTYTKLDISLVRGIDGDDLRQALATGLQYFAARTGCGLIAEGVESVGEANMLRWLGIEFAQGYLFGRPEPAT